LVVGNVDRTKILDATTGKEIAVLPASAVVAISADANVLAAQVNRDEYALWDLRAGRIVATLPLPRRTSAGTRLSLAPDATMLPGYCRWTADNTVTLWDVAARQSRVLKPPESNRVSVLRAEFSPDGKLLAVGYQFQWFTVWDVATGTVKLQVAQKPAMMYVY